MADRKTVILQEDGRLDRVLARSADRSRSQIQQLIKKGDVQIDGEPVTDKSMTVNQGTSVLLPVESRDSSGPVPPEDDPLDVLYEDEYLLVLDKPSGVLVHPTSHQRTGTLVNRILHHYPEQKNVGEPDRAGLVHRLDRATSGVLIVARDEPSLTALKDQFRERTVQKEYRAVLVGEFSDDRLKIDVPIARDPDNPTLRRAHPTGKPAVTILNREGSRNGRSAVWCHPRTGRTHQIRVHMKYLGHPIVGDAKYHRATDDRLMLHAESIEFIHPVTDNSLHVISDPPEEVLRAWNDACPSS